MGVLDTGQGQNLNRASDMLARSSSNSYVLVDDVCSRLRAVEELGFVDRDSVVDRLRPEELPI